MGQYAKDNTCQIATNWISKKKKKNKRNSSVTPTTSFSKILNLQKDYLRDNEGWNIHRSFKQSYRTHLTNQIEKEFFHYKNLSQNDVDELLDLYDKKIQRKKMKLKNFRKTKEAKRQMRKMISETRVEKVETRRAELVIKMNSEMSRRGIILGAGTYLGDRDGEWDRLYHKIHSTRNCHLFDIQSDDEWYQFLKKG
jgi:hypothetical protein